MSFSFPLTCWIVLALFLGTLGGMALAVTKTVAPEARGGNRPAHGCLGGCAAALALFFLCGLGVVGLGAFLTVAAVGSAVEMNPVRRVEIRRSGSGADAPETGALERERILDGLADEPGEGPIHALFTLRSSADGRGKIDWGNELVDIMRHLAGVDASELEDFLTVHRKVASDGSAYDIYEFRLPVTERDLERFEQEIERELDGLKVRLPQSVEIEFEGAEQFY